MQQGHSACRDTSGKVSITGRKHGEHRVVPSHTGGGGGTTFTTHWVEEYLINTYCITETTNDQDSHKYDSK